MVTIVVFLFTILVFVGNTFLVLNNMVLRLDRLSCSLVMPGGLLQRAGMVELSQLRLISVNSKEAKKELRDL